MAKSSFEQEFPDYKIVPEKRPKWPWILAWTAFVVFVVGMPVLLFKGLTYNDTSALTSSFARPKLFSLAMSQSEKGDHQEALRNFERYFALGGQEADAMALYAYSLLEVGRRDDAISWAKKAVDKDPLSKAAKLIHDTLESK